MRISIARFGSDSASNQCRSTTLDVKHSAYKHKAYPQYEQIKQKTRKSTALKMTKIMKATSVSDPEPQRSTLNVNFGDLHFRSESVFTFILPTLKNWWSFPYNHPWKKNSIPYRLKKMLYHKNILNPEQADITNKPVYRI
jgi:hypothetical protein